MAYRMLGPMAHGKIKQIIEETVGSGLIYLNSNARDFSVPEIRPYLDKYLRGSGGTTAIDRVQLMKLLWDAIGREFGVATSCMSATTRATRTTSGPSFWGRRTAWD